VNSSKEDKEAQKLVYGDLMVAYSDNLGSPFVQCNINEFHHPRRTEQMEKVVISLGLTQTHMYLAIISSD
jgi:hypothetical protein